MAKYGIVLATLLFAGCKDGDTDTSGDTDTGTDTDVTPTWEPADDITVDWEAVDTNGSVAIAIVDSGATGFFLGFAETASGEAGWYGEDCSLATGGACHEFTAVSGQLDYVETIPLVVPGSTTLFDGGTDGGGDAFTSSGADRLTYLVQLSGGAYDLECYVWGEDVTYYDSEGCTAL